MSRSGKKAPGRVHPRASPGNFKIKEPTELTWGGATWGGAPPHPCLRARLGTRANRSKNFGNSDPNLVSRVPLRGSSEVGGATLFRGKAKQGVSRSLARRGASGRPLRQHACQWLLASCLPVASHFSAAACSSRAPSAMTRWCVAVACRNSCPMHDTWRRPGRNEETSLPPPRGCHLPLEDNISTTYVRYSLLRRRRCCCCCCCCCWCCCCCCAAAAPYAAARSCGFIHQCALAGRALGWPACPWRPLVAFPARRPARRHDHTPRRCHPQDLVA
jgi:hypothetical protein